MATKKICDLCNKVIRDDENWMSVSLNVRIMAKETYGLVNNYNDWHLCAKCAKKIAPKFVKILKQK